ncbi:MAG: YHYH domain-containing protein [Pseudoxanthomonas sp.]|nr:YHYH domain-containing protein [Pseudoxanthomonas sp.]
MTDRPTCAIAIFALATLLASVFTTLAHPGGLDKHGCHTNRKTGDDHCHRGGAPAHTPLVAPVPDQRPAPPGLRAWTARRLGASSATAMRPVRMAQRRYGEATRVTGRIWTATTTVWAASHIAGAEFFNINRLRLVRRYRTAPGSRRKAGMTLCNRFPAGHGRGP